MRKFIVCLSITALCLSGARAFAGNAECIEHGVRGSTVVVADEVTLIGFTDGTVNRPFTLDNMSQAQFYNLGELTVECFDRIVRHSGFAPERPVFDVTQPRFNIGSDDSQPYDLFGVGDGAQVGCRIHPREVKTGEESGVVSFLGRTKCD